MTTPAKELLPCPFCGATSNDLIINVYEGYEAVQCNDCGVENHIKRWNDRAPDERVEGLVMALNKITFMGSWADEKGDFNDGYVYARRYAVGLAEKALADFRKEK